MALPSVRAVLNADGTGEVWVDDVKLPGVLAVVVSGSAGQVPQVQVTLRPGQVVTDLPETGVQLLRAGPSATEFADRLNPVLLEQRALEHIEVNTQGEAFAAAVRDQAAMFDDRG